MNTVPAVSSRTHVRVPAAGGSRILPLADVLRHLGAEDIVRLRAQEFAGLPEPGCDLIHFNLGYTANSAGRRYAIVPILVAGWRDTDGRETLPVVDPDRCRLATCVDVARRVPIDRISPDLFRYSLPGIRTVAQLREALVERYGTLLPNTSPDDIAARGCTVTRFRLDPD